MTKKQIIGVTACIIKDNKILLLKRSSDENFLPNHFEMPGGEVELGEPPEIALKREIQEEIQRLSKETRTYVPETRLSMSSGKNGSFMLKEEK